MRFDGRRHDQLRPFRLTPDVNKHAEGSCVVEMGDTRVHCTATVTDELPRWRKELGEGWVTAEYRMLPRSTHTRVRREGDHPSGRTAEIQRLIGRSIRAAVDYKALGAYQITVDCDVMQADGGTRTAAINGGFVALALAIGKMIERGQLKESPLKHLICAVSVGLVGVGQAEPAPMLDLCYKEDAGAETDLNLVMTGGGLLVEVQGCAEGEPFPRDVLNELLSLGASGNAEIARAQRALLADRLPWWSL